MVDQKEMENYDTVNKNNFKKVELYFFKFKHPCTVNEFVLVYNCIVLAVLLSYEKQRIKQIILLSHC